MMTLPSSAALMPAGSMPWMLNLATRTVGAFAQHARARWFTPPASSCSRRCRRSKTASARGCARSACCVSSGPGCRLRPDPSPPPNQRETAMIQSIPVPAPRHPGRRHLQRHVGLAADLWRRCACALLNLPEALLRETGLFLIAYAALVGWLGTRQSMPKALVVHRDRRQCGVDARQHRAVVLRRGDAEPARRNRCRWRRRSRPASSPSCNISACAKAAARWRLEPRDSSFEEQSDEAPTSPCSGWLAKRRHRVRNCSDPRCSRTTLRVRPGFKAVMSRLRPNRLALPLGLTEIPDFTGSILPRGFPAVPIQMLAVSSRSTCRSAL